MGVVIVTREWAMDVASLAMSNVSKQFCNYALTSVLITCICIVF